MSQQPQIFQTDNAKRWRNFKWSFRIVAMILIFLLIVLLLTLIRGTNPSIPNLELKGRTYQSKLDPANPLTISDHFNRKYKGFKDFLSKKIKEDSLKNLAGNKHVSHLS